MRAGPEDDREYLAFLRSRWPPRARRLAIAAFAGTLAYLGLDLAWAAGIPGAPSAATIAAARLPWLAIPIAGGLLVRSGGAWRAFPAAATALALAWGWGHDWAYLHLGAPPALRAVAANAALVTAAVFLPFTFRERAGFFALLALGHLAIGALGAGGGATARERLVADAALVVLAGCEVFVFESFARSHRRGFRLRRQLEAAVQDVSRFAIRIAHEVNNPLAAVKANLHWSAGEGLDAPAAERAQVARESLECVDRIAAIVTELKREAAAHRTAAKAVANRSGQA